MLRKEREEEKLMPKNRKEYFHQFYLKNREKYIEKAKKKRKEMNLVSKTILANCFRCQKDFFIKYYCSRNNNEIFTEKINLINSQIFLCLILLIVHP